jgi:hypothetical protein
LDKLATRTDVLSAAALVLRKQMLSYLVLVKATPALLAVQQALLPSQSF